MNRRQFLGASLAGIIAALSLPFERFVEWCRAWIRRDPAEAFLKALEAEVDALYEQHGQAASRMLWGNRGSGMGMLARRIGMSITGAREAFAMGADV